ncbi:MULTISPECIES: C4-dicarboxylate transporter DcuC [unclassified Erysipelothrix]|uniref:C4-dicarboxylate transporter DcuC n=1 Tax=unclassified Erysipelothrix TaxID=2624170 RepID=UPI001378B55B|nr:C4-dicarboxylate transporter DcuC [Erysipelothrix sp. strain 2 (EsS2-6-Brazil)]MBK2403021.1 C4-dicarboxylate ABC transporter [Erysipelothrix sp. strain 2 (EsS2-6-Brazil)]NBA01829.1 C4-dicarboxylate ABC transporter [Erysipelothrix rhusiopathiae]
MSPFVMYGAGLIAVAIVVVMLLKKLDIKITLFGVGILLMMVAIMMGNAVIEEPVHILVDPLLAIIDQFKKTLPSSGFVILVLGGYTAYMNAIGANEVTVNTLTKPLKGIKSAYVLVPIVFLLGNLLSLVIPSASNLSIILLATLYPVLKESGMSTLTAAAIIATTATVMPTPLGADNVAIAAELGMPVADYVFQHHAIVSVPTLLVMALAHTFWQKYCDKKLVASGEEKVVLNVEAPKQIEGSGLYKFVYTLLPLLPILILLVVFAINAITGSTLNLSVEVVSMMSFIIAIACELIRHRDGNKVLTATESFFKGMGNAMGIVVLLVAASTFVNGLKAIGLITQLQTVMQTTQASGFVLPLILVLFTALIVLLSGSGMALFYAMVPLMVPLAAAAGISPFAVTVPMGLAGNLLRAVSPVSAVVMIVAGTTKEEPFDIVKRTSVPMIVGTVFMFVLSMIIF